MTQAEVWFQCCRCRQEWPIGELAVSFSADVRGGRGYCRRCYGRLVDEPPLTMSRSLARDVESTLDAISTDWFTKQ